MDDIQHNSSNDTTLNGSYSNETTASSAVLDWQNMTPTGSPTKLAPHHNIFMTNLQQSPKLSSASNMGQLGSISSSTKVIESLHDQLDTLTNTNLQLTMQSHNLLARLESSTNNENKLKEKARALKDENDSLTHLLSKETIHLKELEVEYKDLISKCNEIGSRNKSLKEKVTKVTNDENELANELIFVENQYNSLVESNKFYESYYQDKMDKLFEQLKLIESEDQDILSKFDCDVNNNEKLLNGSINQFNEYLKELESLNHSNEEVVALKVSEAASKMNLDNWPILYKESKDLLLKYADKMNIDQSTLKFDQADSLTSFALNTPKLRNHNSSSSTNNAARRRSFYGVSSTFMKNNITFTEAKLPSTKESSKNMSSLPGVKRSASIRKTSSGVGSTNNKSSSLPGTAHSSFASSSSHPRSNRNSVIYH